MDSISSAFVNSSTFDSVLSIPWDFGSCWQTEDVMQQMHKMLREKCDNLAEELTASESVNNTIEQEINHLNSELQRLTTKEQANLNPSNTEQSNVISENLYLPFAEKQTTQSGKRNLNELSYMEEDPHPLYGKYFPQNRPQASSVAGKDIKEVQRHPPPNKKIKVVYQERARILDHDYSGASDEETPHQIVPEVEEETSGAFTTSYVSSNVKPVEYLSEQEIQYNRIQDMDSPTKAPSLIVHSKELEAPKEAEPKVKVVFMEETVPMVSEANENEREDLTSESRNVKVVEPLSPEKGKNEMESQTSGMGGSVSAEQDSDDTSSTSPSERQRRPHIIFCTAASQGEKTPDVEK